MEKRVIDPSAKTEDWFGNNFGVTCPRCGKVYVASGFIHEPGQMQGERKCPDCKESTGVVHRIEDKGGEARIIREADFEIPERISHAVALLKLSDFRLARWKT